MATKLNNEYNPDVVTAPGETLKEILEDRMMSQTELAQRLGLTHKTINEIIHGKAPLTHETALGLENVFGIPANFWNSYETTYRAHLTRKEAMKQLEANKSWLDKTPWRQAQKLGWIQAHSSIPAQFNEVLRFLGIASPEEYDKVYSNLVVQWRRAKDYESDNFASVFWLRKGELDALELAKDPDIEWAEYDASRFELYLQQIRALTCDREPTSFVSRLQKWCAFAGVAVVFVPDLEGTKASGATRWLSPTRALIQLSLRYKTNDQLWFSFYHEAAHILKHPKKQVFLEGDKQEQDEYEIEANRFAQDMLIPPSEFASFIKAYPSPSKLQVEDFAEKIGIDPGIVVGRLQREKIISFNLYNDLKQRYDWKQKA